MLNLFAGREIIDKERFIYDRIAESGGEALVLVPDQYTLVAEEQALKYLDSECLFDVEILSMNRLGMRVLTEQGRESVQMLDKYGRFMLLTKLIREHMDDFDIFRRSAGKMTFTAMLNDFISDYKQHDCSFEELKKKLDEEYRKQTDPLLSAKVTELEGVINAYEEAISGKYTDSEDYITMYVEAIGNSAFVRGKNIWVYGYDSFTSKFTNALFKLSEVARSVNLIINRSDFDLDEQMVRMLVNKSKEKGTAVKVREISPAYEMPKSETIRRIERGLWSKCLGAAEKASNTEWLPEDLALVQAADPYCEAENAAAYIWHLVRDLGFKMSDIQVIANDEASMHPIIRRVFAEYGLPFFADTARDITDTAAVAFIVNLLWFATYRNSPQYLFAMLKTGIAGCDDEIIEDLENYARSYHIKGSMWERPFRYGAENIGEEAFAGLESVRAGIMDRVVMLRERSESGTIADFVGWFRRYLQEVWRMDESVIAAADREEELGMHEEAQRIIQSYRKALELLDQIVEIMGDTAMDMAEFTDIYIAGLTDVEVGVIPPSADGLSVGTMIRTRPRPVRAAVVLGANDGVLPLSPSTEGLFSVDEKKYFKSLEFPLGMLDELRENEEKAAMYRMLVKPSEKLYISWSAADAAGGEASPSGLISEITELFPRIETDGLIRRDIVSLGWDQEMIQTPGESMRHMMEHLKDRNVSDHTDPLTRSLLRWFNTYRKKELDTMMRTAADQNDPQPLGGSTAASLYGRRDGSLRLSASSINSYFECPFKFFVDRGLRPREERDFSSDPRSIGDAYHECLMAVARRLMGDRELLRRLGGKGNGETASFSGGESASGNDSFSAGDDELERIVDEELDRIAGEYQGGLFVSAGSERFRMSRIREICSMAARAMAEQLAADSVTGAEFEESFRRGGRFDPINLTVDGRQVYVEGKIDRADMLDVDGEGRVRIVDYKTGDDRLDLRKVRSGYKMQLMIYMISASSHDMEPAGLFYFNIKDPIVSLDNKSESLIQKTISKPGSDSYKLKGVYIEEPGVLGAMPAEVLASSREGGIGREEYESLRSDVLSRIEETAAGILRGNIRIRPFKDGGKLTCNYCSYKAICRRDREYGRNSGWELK